MNEISIVTDSTCDLPEELTCKYGIQVVPNLVIINGESLQDGKEITRQEFYERLPDMKPLPTTAAASSGMYNSVYQSLLKDGANRILSIHPPNSLSGILNAARIAAGNFGDRVHVFDSSQVSLGLGFQVLTAAEMFQQGTRLEPVLSFLEDLQRRIQIVAMLDTLEYVRRSGRVSWARARLGNMLHIKPFIGLKNGVVSSLGECRTRAKGLLRLMSFLQRVGKLERLAILHTNAEGEACKFLNELPVKLDNEPLIVNVTTVIGVHVGPNGLGFAAIAS